MNFGSSLQAVKSRIAEQVNRVRGASQDQSENDEPKISDEPSSDTTSALVGQMALSAHIGDVTAISPAEAAGSSKGGPLSTHVLDTSLGKPGAGVPVSLYIKDAANEWRLVSNGVTNEDGRIPGLVTDNELPKATYKLTFDTETYFKKTNVTGFFPYVDVVFIVRDTTSHYHVPILLSPFGFTTYRGS